MFYLFCIFSFFIGTAIGSFLNCLIYRLPLKKNIFNRSFCPHCQHQLSWQDLVPIFSFLFLRGRCRYCGQKISWQYPLVELIAGLLFLFGYLKFFNYSSIVGSQFLISNFQFLILLRDWLFIAVMVFVFIYDLRYMSIEDIVVIPAIIAVFLLNLFAGQPVISILIGGAMSWLFFLAQYILTKKKGLGEGDLRLGILMGLMFGWPNVLIAIFVSYLIGGLISLILIIGGKKKLFSEIPLGPFLAVGSVLTMFFGLKIVDFYFNLFF